MISKLAKEISPNLISTFLLYEIKRVALSIVTSESFLNLNFINLFNSQRTVLNFSLRLLFIYYFIHNILIFIFLSKHGFLFLLNKSFSSILQIILISNGSVTSLYSGIGMLQGFIEVKLIGLLLSEEINSCLLFSLCLVSSIEKNYLQNLIGWGVSFSR